MLGMWGLLAQFERDLMRERTKAGLEAAALSGKRIGRPPKITADRIAIAQQMAGQRFSRTGRWVATPEAVSDQMCSAPAFRPRIHPKTNYSRIWV